jgi:pimeloyl-ACP methyl ester carboxylesterase
MNRSIIFHGIPVSYSDTGEGRPVVLLHGYLESGEVWQPLTELLSREFRVIAPDLPGHGRSGVAGGEHTMEFLAGAVRAVIADAGVDRLLMVGHSLGGYAALAFAELWPELLSGYVLFHSHPHADSAEAIEKRQREIAVVRAGKKNIMYPGNVSMMFSERNLSAMPEALERIKEIASGNPGEGIIALVNGMISRPSRQSVVESGRVPLLWILGRGDLYFTPERALRDTKLPPNAEVVILENSGHLGFIEETHRSFQLITDFAGRISWQHE